MRTEGMKKEWSLTRKKEKKRKSKERLRLTSKDDRESKKRERKRMRKKVKRSEKFEEGSKKDIEEKSKDEGEAAQRSWSDEADGEGAKKGGQDVMDEDEGTVKNSSNPMWNFETERKRDEMTDATNLESPRKMLRQSRWMTASSMRETTENPDDIEENLD